MQSVAQATKRSASSAPKPSNQDLRIWIDALRAAGADVVLEDLSDTQAVLKALL